MQEPKLLVNCTHLREPPGEQLLLTFSNATILLLIEDKLSPFESAVAIARDPSISAKWSNPVRGRHQSFSTLGSSTLFPNLVTLEGWKAEYTWVLCARNNNIIIIIIIIIIELFSHPKGNHV